LSHQRGKKTNQTKQNKKNTTKCPKFKCNTVSVSFSACRCSSVVVSSKEEQKKKESGDSSVILETVLTVCETPARCCQPAVAGGFIYADLRSELKTRLAPFRLCLLSVLLGLTASAANFPLSKHTGGGDTAPAFSGRNVYLQFT
jgi:hypothetical protein